MKKFIVAFFLLLGSFLLSTWIVNRNIPFDFAALQSFLILVAAWSVSLFLTQKYKLRYRQRVIPECLASFGKAAMIMILFVWFGELIFRVEPNYDDILFAAAGIFIIIEFFAFTLWFIKKNPSSNIEVAAKSDQALKSHNQDSLFTDKNKTVAKPVDIAALFEKFDFCHKDLLSGFILQTIGSDGDLLGEGLIISPSDSNVPISVSTKVSLFVCLRRLNDIRRLNQYLLFSHAKILPTGWLIVRYTSLKTVKKTLRDRYSKPILFFAVALHFLFHQVFPKIPGMEHLYLVLTNGKNQVLSKTELWGRLHYCGFHVLDEMEIDDYHYVIAQKAKQPKRNLKPSYYPIIKLERVGLNGEIIKAHKIRTMFPYSEYLQKKVYEENQLSSSGKFAEDFRITRYGKFLRKFWLDELPQIIDWLRGDLKLVGIRAMSQHYFSLYPREYQELFVQVKPGLIPPIFDESTKNFDDIVEVEYCYLKKYIKNPFKTDIYYLWQTMNKIVLKGVRSH